MIDSYKFGNIVVDGDSYNSDVIIYPDRVDYKWWRKEGHLLQKDDLSDVINYEPEVLIVGTGDPGLMQVPEETIRFLKSKGIQLIVDNTENACKTYNELKKNKKVIAALHLTC